MKSRNIGSLVLCCLLIPGFAGVWKLQEKIDAQFDGMHLEADDLVLRSGNLLKVMSLEYAPLMADLYWTRVVQYYGDKCGAARLEFRTVVAATGCDDDA